MSDPTEGRDEAEAVEVAVEIPVIPPASDRQWLDMLQQAVDAIMIRLEALESHKTQVEVWVGDFEQRMEKLMAKPKSKSKARKARKPEPRTVVRQGAREGGKVDKGRSFRGAVPSGKKSRARR